MPKRFPLWQSGFRPFFLGAGFWAITAMLLWFGILRLGWEFPLSGQMRIGWHGHEMIYGYSIAVVAGFLLTAVPQWTDTQPVGGLPLMAVFGLWIGARIVGLIGSDQLLTLSASLDMAFISGLLLYIAIPVIRKRRWKQCGILLKVILLGAGNLAYYLGVGGFLENGISIGLYSGFYLIIALILTIGRRVIPFFIQRRLGDAPPLRNSNWVDRGSILLFLLFWGLQVFSHHYQWIRLVSLALFFLHAYRLCCWYRPGIWVHPLLWVLLVSYGFIVLGFAVVAAPLFGFLYSPFLGLHLFAIGGIGLITSGMMARVSIGHTGRDVENPPPAIVLAFLLIILSAIVRVGMPLFFIDAYLFWLVLSQWLWIGGFLVFLLSYLPILTGPDLEELPAAAVRLS